MFACYLTKNVSKGNCKKKDKVPKECKRATVCSVKASGVLKGKKVSGKKNTYKCMCNGRKIMLMNTWIRQFLAGLCNVANSCEDSSSA